MTSKHVYFIFEVETLANSNAPKHEEFYGWTNYKKVCTAFLEQRTDLGIQYSVIKHHTEEIPNEFELLMENETMIDILTVRSCKNGCDMHVFTTEYETIKIEAEIKAEFQDIIQELYNDMDKHCKNTTEAIARVERLFCSIRKEYLDALRLIGYNPIDFDELAIASYDDHGEDYIFNNPSRAELYPYKSSLFLQTISSFESIASVLSKYANTKIDDRR